MRRPPAPPERVTHIAVANMLDLILAPPAFWFSYPAGASTLSPQQRARHSEIGLKRGLPDIWIVCGATYCIELKRAGSGRLSKTRIAQTKRGARLVLGQEEVFTRLLEAGVTEIAICRTVDEVLQQLEWWQIPLRPYHRVASPSMTSIPTEPSRSSSTPTTRRRRSAQSPSSETAYCSTPTHSSKPD